MNKQKTGRTRAKARGVKRTVTRTKAAVKRAPARKSTQSKSKFPHFRIYHRYEKPRPTLVTGEHSKDEWKYRKVTHSKKDSHRKNEKVSPNPNPNDKTPMYIETREKHDRKTFFGLPLPWKYKPQKKKPPN